MCITWDLLGKKSFYQDNLFRVLLFFLCVKKTFLLKIKKTLKNIFFQLKTFSQMETKQYELLIFLLQNILAKLFTRHEQSFRSDLAKVAANVQPVSTSLLTTLHFPFFQRRHLHWQPSCINAAATCPGCSLDFFLEACWKRRQTPLTSTTGSRWRRDKWQHEI